MLIANQTYWAFINTHNDVQDLQPGNDTYLEYLRSPRYAQHYKNMLEILSRNENDNDENLLLIMKSLHPIPAKRRMPNDSSWGCTIL